MKKPVPVRGERGHRVRGGCGRTMVDGRGALARHVDPTPCSIAPWACRRHDKADALGEVPFSPAQGSRPECMEMCDAPPPPPKPPHTRVVKGHEAEEVESGAHAEEVTGHGLLPIPARHLQGAVGGGEAKEGILRWQIPSRWPGDLAPRQRAGSAQAPAYPAHPTHLGLKGVDGVEPHVPPLAHGYVFLELGLAATQRVVVPRKHVLADVEPPGVVLVRA